MALLVGRHLNKVDAKGRVSVPKPFRDALAGTGFVGVYIYPYFKDSALEGAGESFMRRLADSLEGNLDLFSDAQEELAAITLESTHALAFDPEGRVSLPDELRAHAGLVDHALFVGRGSRFQIWAPDAYQSHRGDALERARKEGATLRLNPPDPGGD